MKNKLFLITGPSGVGKTTLLLQVLMSNTQISRVVAHTSRDPRRGEENGKHYHFISNESFQSLIAQDRFLEWAMVYGEYKGTLKESYFSALEISSVIKDINVEGALSLKKLLGDQVVTVYVTVDNYSQIEERLRISDEERVGVKRAEAFSEEESKKDLFDYIVNNTDLEEGIFVLKEIISSYIEG